jgi:demethylmenaquinone methyltransferase/2-methoxy-6-polyprenyl-1,4-benzoquinol methylase
MVRVTKPEGAICCIDSFYPRKKWMLPFYELYFSSIMPWLGGGRNHIGEYAWLYESTKRFVGAEELGALMRESGLTGVSAKEFMLGTCVLLIGYRAKGG